MATLKTIALIALIVLAVGAVYFWHRESVKRALADHELAELKPQIEQVQREKAQLETERDVADKRAEEAAETEKQSAVEAARQRAAAVAATRRAEASDAERIRLVNALRDSKPPADLPDCLAQLATCRDTAFKLDEDVALWRTQAETAETSYQAKESELAAMGRRLATTEVQITTRDRLIATQQTQLDLKDRKIELLEGRQQSGFWNWIRGEGGIGATVGFGPDGKATYAIGYSRVWRLGP